MQLKWIKAKLLRAYRFLCFIFSTDLLPRHRSNCYLYLWSIPRITPDYCLMQFVSSMKHKVCQVEYIALCRVYEKSLIILHWKVGRTKLCLKSFQKVLESFKELLQGSLRQGFEKSLKT